MSKPVIRLENISKQYRIGMLQERPDTLRDVLTAGVQRAGRFLKRGGDGLLSALARPEHLVAAADHLTGVVNCTGGGFMAFRPERAVPRCSAYGALHHPGMDVCFADCLPN